MPNQNQPAPSSSSWFVLVSNVGTVLSTEDEIDARATFEDYAIRSVLSTGSRAYRETVSLVSPEGEPVETFLAPWTDEDGEPVSEEDLGASILELLESGDAPGSVYSVGSSYEDWTWTEYAEGGSVSWSSLKPVDGRDYRERMLAGEFLLLIPDACSGSDYSGGALARANVSALQEIVDEDGIVSFSVSGSHGSHGIALPLWQRGTDLGISYALRGLSSYPVVCEDALQEIEGEDEEETWESSIRSDLVREIESVHGVDVDAIAEDALVRLFYDLQESTGETWEHTEEGAWISVERLVDGTERAALLEIPGAVSASADEEEDAARTLLLLRDIADGLPSRERLAEIEDRGADADSVDLVETLESVRETLAERAGLVSVSEEPLSSLLRLVREIGSVSSVHADSSEALSRARDLAQERVLPLLRLSYPSTAREIAETWERDLETGLPILSAYRLRVERAYRESVLSGLSGSERRSRARTVRSGLSLVSEEALQALHESGASPEDAARSLLLDRVSEDVTRAGWILVREEDGTSPRGDVLSVDREREEILVRLASSGEERTVSLLSQAYRVRD